ncbi:scaffolding protein [Mycobacterium phage Archetta]|uniref:Scaffolding protein n=1 Tax=Mycobacterium phage Archetta TaxID=2047836 RepID=A0A2H4PF73_9CAUD|nr:head scaffolding protein [Mycobacterium phage Archetta]ATW60883.1 scaffolding protein [Mycobacterium phage Archetta]QGJ97210.1 scaffolding protein [Mycobacterium phage Lev2]WNN94244.1 scaffolding protein [Mycobacterium phage PickleBack]
MPDTPSTETPDAGATTETKTDEAAKTFSAEYVKDLREEAARYRTEKKDAVEAAKTETRAEVVAEYEPQIADRDTKIAELERTVADQTAELLKLKAVVDAKVPVEDVFTVAELVHGADQESISESVKRVMSIYGKKQKPDVPTDPSQGSGGATPLNGDPIANLLKRAVGAK